MGDHFRKKFRKRKVQDDTDTDFHRISDYFPKRSRKLPFLGSVTGLKYTGPGNTLDWGEPVSELEAASKKHDEGYNLYKNPYFRWNSADSKYLNRLHQIKKYDPNNPIFERLAHGTAISVFTAKRIITGAFNKLFGYKQSDRIVDDKFIKGQDNKYSRSIRKSSGTMARYRRGYSKRTGFGRRKTIRPIRNLRFKRSSLRASASRFKGGRRYGSTYSKIKNAVTAIMNPPKIFEQTYARQLTTEGKDFLWFDPSVIMTASAATVSPANPWTLSNELAAYNSVYGGGPYDLSRKYKVLSRMHRYRITNHSNATIFLKCHYLVCSSAVNNDMTALLSDVTGKGISGDTGTQLVNYLANFTVTSSRNYQLSDGLLLKFFRIYNTQIVKLEPQQTTTFVQMQNTPVNSRELNSVFVKGSRAMLIKAWSNISDASSTEPGYKVAYPKSILTYEQYFRVKFGTITDTTATRYSLFADAGTDNITTDAEVFTDMTDVNDVA